MITPFPKIFVIKVVILQLESVGHQQKHNPLAYMTYIYTILSLQCIIAELQRPKGPPSGAPYSYRKEKETHELIFSWLSWLAVLLVGAYA